MGYSSHVIKGFSWGTFFDLTGKADAVLKMAILARVFDPSQIGVFGIGILVLGLLELLTETGVNIFLVQENVDVKYYLNSAWVVSIARGFVISLFLILFSYPISVFFKSPESRNVILLISLVPFLRGFINPALVTLQKDLKFRADSFFRFSIGLIEDIFMVVFSLLTRSVLGLVLGMLFGVIIEVALTFILIKPRPKFSFEFLHLKKIVNRGKWVTFAYIFDYFFEHLDDIAVGKIMSVASLGIYQYAYNLSIVPLKSIAGQIGRVTFPVYVKMVADEKRIKSAFRKIFLGTLVLVSVFGIGLFLVSEPAVRIILGEKWLKAIPVLKVLAIFGVVRALNNLFYPLFLSYKKQEYVSAVTLVSLLVLAVSVIPLINLYGLVGAAVSALLGALVSLPISFYFFKRLFKQSLI